MRSCPVPSFRAFAARGSWAVVEDGRDIMLDTQQVPHDDSHEAGHPSSRPLAVASAKLVCRRSPVSARSSLRESLPADCSREILLESPITNNAPDRFRQRPAIINASMFARRLHDHVARHRATAAC